MRKMSNLIGLGGRTALTALLACTVACLLSVSSAKASLIAGWTIPTANSAGLNATTASTTPPVTAAALGLSVTPSYVTGTTVNNTAAGGNGTTASSAISIATSTTITIHLSGLGSDGLSSFILTYAAQNNGGTARTQSWGYSTTGSSYVTTGVTQPGSIAGNNSWTTYIVNFSGANAALAGADNVYFRLTMTGGRGGASFDNFAVNATVTPVPEPITYAMAVFGFVFIGGSAGHFYLGRRRLAAVS